MIKYVEYLTRFEFHNVYSPDKDDEFWICCYIEGKPYARLGPFNSDDERQRAYDDFKKMAQANGVLEVVKPQ